MIPQLSLKEYVILITADMKKKPERNATIDLTSYETNVFEKL